MKVHQVKGLIAIRPPVQTPRIQTFRPLTIAEAYAYQQRCKRPPQSVAGQG